MSVEFNTVEPDSNGQGPGASILTETFMMLKGSYTHIDYITCNRIHQK